jgi:hypothetical protein
MTDPDHNPERRDKALKALEQLSRAPRRRRGLRLSLAPFYLGMGLIVAHQLLVRFVPMVWSATLPGGIEQAHTLRGWGGLLWSVCMLVYMRFNQVAPILTGAWIIALLASLMNRYLRLLVWVAAVAVVMLDFGILAITLETALRAGMREIGAGW